VISPSKVGAIDKISTFVTVARATMEWSLREDSSAFSSNRGSIARASPWLEHIETAISSHIDYNANNYYTIQLICTVQIISFLSCMNSRCKISRNRGHTILDKTTRRKQKVHLAFIRVPIAQYKLPTSSTTQFFSFLHHPGVSVVGQEA